MLIKITRLEKIGGFKFRVRFSDGSEGTHDFAAPVREPGPMLESLHDQAHFGRFSWNLVLRLGQTASTLRPNGCGVR
jgi:hypothetical protein